MGSVLTEATIQNLEDLWSVQKGQLPPDQARQITVADALVDTGATSLGLPTRLIQQLGSDEFSQREQAQQKLATLGEPALEPLRKAAQGDDYEVRRRARDLIQTIALAVTAYAAGEATLAEAAPPSTLGFHTIGVNHISYSVSGKDYGVESCFWEGGNAFKDGSNLVDSRCECHEPGEPGEQTQ